jgi:hypothetical protein
MTVRAIRQPRVTDALSFPTHSSGSEAVPLLQAFALAVMLIPSTTVIGPIGAPGYPASLIGVFLFALLLATVLLGFHDPTRHRHPIQAVLALFWLSMLTSYVLLDRGRLTVTQVAGADRMVIQLMMVTGAALVAAEWLRSLSEIRSVLRVLCWGGAICGAIAVLQYGFDYDLAQYLRDLPGFTQNHDNPATIARGGLNRATGTSITPIELGVVEAMLLPIAVYLALYDRDRSPLRRWTPVALIGMAMATSVSRSGLIAVIVAFGVLVVLLPPVPRFCALCVVPFAVAGTFVTAHGLIGTLTSFFGAGSADSSIEWRLHDYPIVERMWNEAPWFGHGAGTYIPVNPLDIFDNQYLQSAVELGAVGVVALAVFLFVPASCALLARRRSDSSELRVLCAALAGAGFAAALCSLTFDSLAFPMFANVYALVIGVIGACWRLAEAKPATVPMWPRRVPE